MVTSVQRNLGNQDFVCRKGCWPDSLSLWKKLQICYRGRRVEQKLEKNQQRVHNCWPRFPSWSPLSLAFTDALLSWSPSPLLGHSFVVYTVKLCILLIFNKALWCWWLCWWLAMLMTPVFISLALSLSLNFRFIISNCLIISTCQLDICLYGTQTPQSHHHLNSAHQISFRPALSPLTPFFFLFAQLRNCGVGLSSFVFLTVNIE